MKRYWLLFSQAVTVLLAAYFIVATLQPSWLKRGATYSRAGISLLEAPSEPRTEFAPGSLAGAAQKAMHEHVRNAALRTGIAFVAPAMT